MTSLDALMTPVSRDDAESLIYDVLTTLGVPTSSWKPGSVVRAIITANAVAISSFSALVAIVAKAQFLDTATGNWLKLNAWFNYATAPQDATFPAGSITLTNSGGGVYTVGAGSLIVKNTTTGATFANVSAFTLSALSTLSVGIVGQIQGTAGNALPGEISTLVTPLVGVSCTNPLAVLGIDAETEDSLRIRARAAAASVSPNGPADVYDAVARAAVRADGSPIGITRTRVIPSGAGEVLIFVANASGNVPDSDIFAIQSEILDKACPPSVTPYVIAAVPRSIAVTCDVWARSSSGLTAAQIQSAVSSSLTEWLENLPLGGDHIGSAYTGYAYRDALLSAIAKARPEIYHVTLTTPATDFLLQLGDTADLGALSVTVHLVS